MIEVVIHLCCPMSRLTLCFIKRQISLLNHCSLGFSAWVRRSEVVNRPCTHVLIQSLSISTPSIGRKLLARKIKLGPSAFFQLFAASSPIVSQGLFLGHMFCWKSTKMINRIYTINHTFFFFFTFIMITVFPVSRIPTPNLTKAVFVGGCLTQVPAELNDHRTKVEGRAAACSKERGERILSGKGKKRLPMSRLIK